MADTFQKIFKSDLFTFQVGKNRKTIVVHSVAITEQSKALNALVNNNMAESQTRSAVLDDIEEEDFIRFCQFAYTGDYSTPPFTKDKAARSEEREAPLTDAPHYALASPDDEDDMIRAIIKKGKKSKKERNSMEVLPPAIERTKTVWGEWGVDVSQVAYQDLKTLQENFENRQFCKELPRQKLLDSCEPLPNNRQHHNFTPVFLAHARLYVFADKYGIQPLQQLVLQKLHQTLVRFELYPKRVEDIVELVRFTYSDEHTLGDGSDELRALVAVYMASRIDKLNKSSSFLTLLEEGGAFVRDFWLLVRNAVYV